MARKFPSNITILEILFYQVSGAVIFCLVEYCRNPAFVIFIPDPPAATGKR